ncbi:MAG: glycosyltransferase family 2 protein [Kofleriaceae bacterium]|nr:glycosyltransferase family 2 protein [Kofleriaceae bacterium]
MNIVMPMAGRGSRFFEVGVSVPKPLIQVRGVPMYAWAMASLPLELANRVVFVCLAEHLEKLSLADDIRTRYRHLNVEIIALDHVTRGQAETVLIAKKWIDSAESLLIFNADTFMRSDLGTRLSALPPTTAGLLSVFQAPGDHWSFARTDASGRVLETAEKRRISPWASNGLYYFAHGYDFVTHAEAMIRDDQRERDEFYVAPVYNRLIQTGAEVVIDVAHEVWGLGTPAELANFEAMYRGPTPSL